MRAFHANARCHRAPTNQIRAQILCSCCCRNTLMQTPMVSLMSAKKRWTNQSLAKSSPVFPRQSRCVFVAFECFMLHLCLFGVFVWMFLHPPPSREHTITHPCLHAQTQLSSAVVPIPSYPPHVLEALARTCMHFLTLCLLSPVFCCSH